MIIAACANVYAHLEAIVFDRSLEVP